MGSAATAPETSGPVPAGATAAGPPRHRPVLRWVALGLLALALLVVWALGGFRGGSNVTTVQAGEELDLGPATITVREATARPAHGGGWTVALEATCQVRGDDPPDLALLAQDFYSLATASRPTHYSESHAVRFEPAEQFGLERDHLSPGLAPMPCRLQGTLPGDFRPQDGLRVAIAKLEWGDDSVVGGQDEHWFPSNHVYGMKLPVRVLPAG